MHHKQVTKVQTIQGVIHKVVNPRRQGHLGAISGDVLSIVINTLPMIDGKINPFFIILGSYRGYEKYLFKADHLYSWKYKLISVLII